MTDNKQGRVQGPHVLHDAEKPELCPNGIHDEWRCVRCDGDTDVVECRRCGRQKEVRCTFDDDYD